MYSLYAYWGRLAFDLLAATPLPSNISTDQGDGNVTLFCSTLSLPRVGDLYTELPPDPTVYLLCLKVQCRDLRCK